MFHLLSYVALKYKNVLCYMICTAFYSFLTSPIFSIFYEIILRKHSDVSFTFINSFLSLSSNVFSIILNSIFGVFVDRLMDKDPIYVNCLIFFCFFVVVVLNFFLRKESKDATEEY